MRTRLQSNLLVFYRVEAEAVARRREYLRSRGDHDSGEEAGESVRSEERHAAIQLPVGLLPTWLRARHASHRSAPRSGETLLRHFLSILITSCWTATNLVALTISSGRVILIRCYADANPFFLRLANV